MESKSPTAKTAMVSALWGPFFESLRQHWRQKITVPQRRATRKISSKNLTPEKAGRTEMEHVSKLRAPATS